MSYLNIVTAFMLLYSVVAGTVMFTGIFLWIIKQLLRAVFCAFYRERVAKITETNAQIKHKEAIIKNCFNIAKRFSLLEEIEENIETANGIYGEVYEVLSRNFSTKILNIYDGNDKLKVNFANVISLDAYDKLLSSVPLTYLFFDVENKNVMKKIISREHDFFRRNAEHIQQLSIYEKALLKCTSTQHCLDQDETTNLNTSLSLTRIRNFLQYYTNILRLFEKSFGETTQEQNLLCRSNASILELEKMVKKDQMVT